ncbi:MAG: hypothetical protein CO118_11210 [Flavobacteriales bacterium CG_4_9_14_3_um_filter_32_8]|nr:MAG: hypothetical protein CO118_11210 [Flavobacteriales bacterium CG_4_9_14_3_um_filter_32_8]
MIKHYLIAIAFLMFTSIEIFGQNDSVNIKQPELDSGTIENQFDYILTKSSSFKEFRLIRKTSLLKVRDHVIDSLKIIRKELVSTSQSTPEFKLKINALEKEVAELKKGNQNTTDSINENINTISLFGININKSYYNIIFCSIIIVLLLLLIIIISRFKRYQSKTSKINEDIVQLESEFESYRKNSLKKEQEIMRKLQDEINKNSH